MDLPLLERILQVLSQDQWPEHAQDNRAEKRWGRRLPSDCL